MKFHLLTIFPEFFRGPFEHGVVARGVAAGLVEIRIHNLRDWTSDSTRLWTTGRSVAGKGWC